MLLITNGYGGNDLHNALVCEGRVSASIITYSSRGIL